MGTIASTPRIERTFPAWSLGPRRRELITGYALCIPAFACVIALLAYPLAYDVYVSLTNAHGFEGTGDYIGFANYARAFADPYYWQAVRNTVVLVGITVIAEVGVGLLTSLLLWWRFWGRSLVFLAVFVPWAFPASFSAFSWYWLLLPPFHSNYSMAAIHARFWLEGLFGSGAYAVLSLLLMNVWRGSSIIAIILLAGFNAIPDELLDYGRLETSNAWRFFWRVMAPLNRRFLGLAALIGLVITYLDVVSMYVETGGRILVPVIGTLAFQHGILVGHTAYAAALSMTQVPVFFLLGWLGLRLVQRERTERVMETRASPVARDVRWERRPIAAPAPRRRLLSWRTRRRLIAAAGMVAAVGVLVFHLFPVYFVSIQAVRPLEEFKYGNLFWAMHPDWAPVLDMLRDPVLVQWSWNTLIVFGAVLVLGLGAALVAGYALARMALPGAAWFARAAFVSYFFPQLATIIPVFQLYGWLRLDNTLTGIILLYLTLTVPFSTWLFYAFFQGLDREVEEHAWLDASRRQAFVRVVLPMSLPVIIAAGLFGVGMMGSDLLYSSMFTLSNSSKTLPAGLGLTAIDLDEWSNVNAAILVSSIPLVVACAALGRYYVQGLRAALVEGA